eukprot:TRINITY_DN4922_c0_g2_i1.p1 TRINITY_DN4922_c0_g2~~TRINITY_DN4922_c0_g2_i1.p1  ORF type:complete len:261 (+),score=57.07 TRINITY_DN4922_c0_g2_i1:61-783(+)
MLNWVKQQAAGVSETISKDLSEFAAVVQSDTRALVKTDSNKNDILNQVELFEEDITTYTTEVRDEGYESYTIPNLKAMSEETLKNSARVNTFYDELVPDRVSEEDFWKRYYFRLDKLMKDEERKKLLREIEEKEKKSKNQEKTDEWVDCTNTDREELATLLAESRKECKMLREKLALAEAELEKYRENDDRHETATPVLVASELSTPSKEPSREETTPVQVDAATTGTDKNGDWDTLANW